MIVDMIGWAGTIFMIVGSIINIYKHTWCWPVWIIGGALICIQGALISAWNITALQLMYMPLNIYGWYQWRRDDENSRT